MSCLSRSARAFWPSCSCFISFSNSSCVSGCCVALLLLAALAGAAALVHLERVVHQLLLLAHHVGQLVHLPHHLLVGRRHLAGLRHLQIVEHLLQLAEELLGGVHVAELGEVLDAVEQVLQVLVG